MCSVLQLKTFQLVLPRLTLNYQQIDYRLLTCVIKQNNYKIKGLQVKKGTKHLIRRFILPTGGQRSGQGLAVRWFVT